MRTWAGVPYARIQYMYLTRRVDEPQELSGNNRNGVLHVINVNNVLVCIDVVRKCLIANLAKGVR